MEHFCLNAFLSNFFFPVSLPFYCWRGAIWKLFCDSLTVRIFYTKSNSWLFLHFKLGRPRARPKLNQWHLFAIKTFWSLYNDQRHWYVCLKNCTLLNLKVTDLLFSKSQCLGCWKWWLLLKEGQSAVSPPLLRGVTLFMFFSFVQFCFHKSCCRDTILWLLFF